LELITIEYYEDSKGHSIYDSCDIQLQAHIVTCNLLTNQLCSLNQSANKQWPLRALYYLCCKTC